MTISQEFKDKIKAGKFREALILALSESIELTVTTSVVNDLTATESDTYISTEVNLVEGEITNSISKDILANPELCKLHFEQVKQGQEIIFNNLKSFQTMLGFLEEVSESQSPELPENSPKSLPSKDNSNHDSD
ncbi:MAG: hypothetical protein EA365_06625 [Gloeocapsa sp. DLM2.Bin57]|nr:MAG: hypothetical protein EA365_06625 [Gloeocapsa sp. DLM2.Bin57]